MAIKKCTSNLEENPYIIFFPFNMKSAFLLGTTDYIGFKTTAVYRLHLVELVNGKKFAKKSNFSKKHSILLVL